MKDPERYIKRWRFGNRSKSIFEVGPMFFSMPEHTINYFMMRICSSKINWNNYTDFYNYHLAHYKRQNPEADELEFFKFISSEVQNAINSYVADRFNTRSNKIRFKLQDFYEFLQTRDVWGICELTPDEKDLKIRELEEKVKKLSELEILDHNRIELGKIGLKTFVDVVLQLQELKDIEGKPYFPSTVQTTWVRLITNTCMENGSAIKQSKIYDYFKVDGPPIGSSISRKRYLNASDRKFRLVSTGM